MWTLGFAGWNECVSRGSQTARRGLACTLALATGGVLSAPATAQFDPNSGTEFVTVGAPGNAPYTGPGFPTNGRGQVNYEFAIARTEVSSAQWVEYLNAVFDRPAGDRIVFASGVRTFGGAGVVPINAGNPDARRWTVLPGRELYPVSGISWYNAAMYCNWLHNDKQTHQAAFLNGVYDLTTGTVPIFRQPGARYFLPSLDEWTKAVHYDPAKQNADGSVGGWWEYGNRSDQPFVGGPPGAFVNGQPTTANAGWTMNFPDFPQANQIALGSYPTVTSPWGLLDVAGGGSEWMDTFLSNGFDWGARFDGSNFESGSSASIDSIRGGGGEGTLLGVFAGRSVRLGMAIPSPSTGFMVLFVGCAGCTRRRRVVK